MGKTNGKFYEGDVVESTGYPGVKIHSSALQVLLFLFWKSPIILSIFDFVLERLYSHKGLFCDVIIIAFSCYFQKS